MKLKIEVNRVIKGFVVLLLSLAAITLLCPPAIATYIVEVLILLFVAAEGGISWLLYRCATQPRRKSRKPKIERLMKQLSKKLTQHSQRD